MPGEKNVHVTYHKDKDLWAVVRDNYDKVSAYLNTKQDAVDRAKSIAKRDHVELLIHRKNGFITDRESYGNDPCPPKDRD
jgi:uncharacterized protein YdaT